MNPDWSPSKDPWSHPAGAIRRPSASVPDLRAEYWDRASTRHAVPSRLLERSADHAPLAVVAS